jgi:hypothetical protein
MTVSGVLILLGGLAFVAYLVYRLLFFSGRCEKCNSTDIKFAVQFPKGFPENPFLYPEEVGICQQCGHEVSREPLVLYDQTL